MYKQSAHFFDFGPFRLDPNERVLLRDGQPVSLTPKAFETLLALVEQHGHILEKEILMKRVWPDTIVEEVNLAKNVSFLRRLLGEADGGQNYIETVPKRGYRFVAPVSEWLDEGVEVIVHEIAKTHIVIDEEEPAPQFALTGAPTSEALALLAGSQPQPFWRRRTSLFLFGVLLLVVAATGYYWRTGQRKEQLLGTQVRSLAVLPFKFVGVTEEDAYLGLGLTDALITKLVNLRQVVVRPTSAVLKYQPDQRDLLAAGRELQVEAVLDGRVQKYGEQLRISLQLVRVADGAALWGGEFAGREADILTLQDAMGERVARSLVEHLSSEERQLLAKRCTDNAEACHAYLKGRYFWHTLNDREEKAIPYFEQAIAKDARYAPAYASLTDCYYTLSFLRGAAELKQKARAAAIKALEIDETLAEGHSALAFIKLMEDWDWAGAQRAAKRAIELNPNHATARDFYGWMLTLMGRTTEAIVELQRAQELDPLSLLIKKNLAAAFWVAGQYEQAVGQCRQILELDASNQQARGLLGLIDAEQGNYQAAVAELQKVKSETELPMEPIAYLGYVYGKWGKRAEALKQLDELKRSRQRNQDTAVFIALIQVGLDEKEQALATLQQGYEKRDSSVFFGIIHPGFNSLRADARFQDLRRRMGLEL